MNTVKDLRVRTLAMSLLTAPLLAAPSPADVVQCDWTLSLDKLYLEGEAAPGSGADFQTFDRPNMSATGSVAYSADTDGDSSLDDVVYRDLTLIAQQGFNAPDSGGQYSSFEFFETAHQINAAGEVAYITSLTGLPTSANRAVYLDDALIAQEGDAAPGIDGRFFSDFGFAGSTGGGVGFLADLDGDTDTDSVIYYNGVPLYQEGDLVPGLEGMIIFDGNFDEIQWNENCDLLFEGDTNLPSGDKVVIRRLNNTGQGVIEEIVVQEGKDVDASGGEDFLELILQNALAENGTWAMRGTLGVAPSDSNAIILAENGFQAQEGDPVPELKSVVLGNFNGVATNSQGDVLYLADLEGDTPPNVDEGLFINGCLIITTGAGAPGIEDETVLLTDIGFEDLSSNDNREFVFQARYTNGAGLSGDGLFTGVATPPSCDADIAGGDGVVDVFDLLDLLANWGPCPGCPADLTGDNVVDVFDLLDLLAAWGPCD